MISVSFPNKQQKRKTATTTAQEPENHDRKPTAAEKRHLEHTLSRTKKNLKHFSFDHYNCYAISHFVLRPLPRGRVVARCCGWATESKLNKSIVQLQTIRREIANDYFFKSFQSHIISRLSDTWHQRNYFNNLIISYFHLFLREEKRHFIS